MNKSGDASSKDGSVLSFMATHALPTAYAMNSSETSSGGWNSCAVRGKLRSGGEIYNNFPSDLRNNIKQVKKLTVKDDTGDSFTAPTQTTTDLFWLMSYRELVATGNFVKDASPNEGTTYQLCNKKKIDGETENNSVIGAMCRTRAGRSPGNLWFSSPTTGVTWLRAPYASWGFRAIAYTPVQPGVVDYHWQADECMGVAPCFCF